MITIVQLVTFLLYFADPSETQGVQRCMQSTCTECLKSPGCAWCKQTDFLKAGESDERRCDTEESLTNRQCDVNHLINPKAELEELKNNDLSDNSDNVIQLKPQNLKLKLRVGVPQTFSVSFKRAEGYPIDLYYLMDLSFSMRDDLDMIKNLGQDIVSTLGNFTTNIRIGFGSFVDKVALPYVSQVKAKRSNPCPSRIYTCQPAFSFQSILSLTKDATDFKKEVSRQRISGNLDSPEAGFDAIMQAAVCQDVIGWKNVTRILVYTSDDTFHMAGDGRLAGIFEPHDGKCHLNGSGFYDGTKFDYPSIGHLSRVLSANNIQLIFAVTEESVSSYKALSKLIPQSVVGVLKNDSSNVVQLISEAYNNLSSTILLEHQGTPQGLQVSYQSHCVPSQGSTPWKKRGECMDVKINEQVDFTVQLNISKCLKETTEFYLKVQGISESLKIAVETLCDCNCKDREELSPHCNMNGTLSCGICSCNSGFLGHKCECEQKKDVTSLDASCRQETASQLCSGHGICECGKCRCQSGYSGSYCQCDDNSCARHDGKLCGGSENGRCNCGTCDCLGEYTGRTCECYNVTHQCITKEQKGNADVKKNCSERCGFTELHQETGAKDLPCNAGGFMYEVKHSTDGIIHVHYAVLPGSIDKTFVVIVSSVSGIIFIGLAVILISRLLLELRYTREYRSFLKAQKDTEWRDTHNPLFQHATTTIVNPMHIQE
ncbi:integrin beta-7 isoform 2-T2 [Polymixia lowei]